MIKRKGLSFAAFFMIWAEYMGWEVPDFHLEICHFLEKRGRKAVLMVFRGAAKSTLVALYQAWKLREDGTWRIIDRAADDSTATKLSADTKNVLIKHVLCEGMTRGKLGIEKFNILDNPDARNASVTAHGIMSNVTGSRANEMVNDDTEVPKNIKTPEAREGLRAKLAEETHILIPGGNLLYIGTPHTHNSLYDEKIQNGYEHLTIPLFKHNKRHEGNSKKKTFGFNFPVKNLNDLYVMVGRKCLDMTEYMVEDGAVILKTPPRHGVIVDIYSGNVWPERFNRAEINFKREECTTQNEWDSQYLLKAKPIHNIRLDPDRMVRYSAEPEIRYANGETVMMLNNRRIVGCSTRWDVALGKPDSDDSVLAVMFTDDRGHLYWHVAELLEGDIYAQCKQIKAVVLKYSIPNVNIETNGPGGFAPAILRKEMKDIKGVAVSETHSSTNKQKRILDAYEAPLSGAFLHVHNSVWRTKMPEQMKDWKAISANQPDDFIDAGEGCITGTPVRIGKVTGPLAVVHNNRDWRPDGGTHEVSVNYN